MELAAPGGINAPAAMSMADITAVFGMISSVRLEHVGAAVITGGTREQAAHRNNPGRDVVTFARLSDAQRQKDFDNNRVEQVMSFAIRATDRQEVAYRIAVR